jgi:hypothetical protein
MGFINEDEVKFTTLDITKTNCYYTLKAECSIRKQFISGVVKYCIYGSYDIYSSKQTYLDGKQPIERQKHVAVLVDSLTGLEPLTALYTSMKESLTNVVDDV